MKKIEGIASTLHGMRSGNHLLLCMDCMKCESKDSLNTE